MIASAEKKDQLLKQLEKVKSFIVTHYIILTCVVCALGMYAVSLKFFSRALFLSALVLLQKKIHYSFSYTSAGNKSSFLRFDKFHLFKVLYFLFAIEFIFLFIPYPHHYKLFTKSGALWKQYYHRPLSAKERCSHESDKSITGDSVTNIFRILTVGDYISTGESLRKVSAGFPEILKQKLSRRFTNKEFSLQNISIEDYDMIDKYLALTNYIHTYGKHFKPSLILFQCQPSDIVRSAAAYGEIYTSIVPLQRLNFFFKTLVTRSYMLNFIYWYFSPESREHSDDYYRWLVKCFSIQTVYDEHREEFILIRDFAAMHKIPIVFVLFPAIQETEDAYGLYSPISEYLSKNKITYVDVQKCLSGNYGLGRISIVGNNSRLRPGTYPSAGIHAITAQALEKTVLDTKILR